MASSFLSRLTMWWFNSICLKGMGKPLEISDLYELNEGDRAGHLVPRWFHLWDKEMDDFSRRRTEAYAAAQEKSKRGRTRTPMMTADYINVGLNFQKFRNDQFQNESELLANTATSVASPSIFWCLFRLFKVDIATAMIAKFASDLLTFCNPLLLKYILLSTCRSLFFQNADQLHGRFKSTSLARTHFGYYDVHLRRDVFSSSIPLLLLNVSRRNSGADLSHSRCLQEDSSSI